MTPKPDLSQQKIVLLTHVLVTGPFHDLKRYLENRCSRLFCIWHPLQPFTPNVEHQSGFELIEQGRTRLKHQRRQPSFISVFGEMPLFIWHGFLSFIWSVRHARGSDRIIAINPLNALVGIFIKNTGIVRHVTYYVIDYVPNRYPAPWLNSLYHAIDRFCVRHSDQVWNLSSRMVAAREKAGLSTDYRQKQITVPIGTDLRVTPLSIQRVNRKCVVYFGGLMEKQGVQLGVEALGLLKHKVPDAKLLVMGGGSNGRTAQLKELAVRCGVSDAVEFTGVIQDHDEALSRLTQCAVGIAPYTDDPDNFTQYTDPGKPKAYLSAGLPVIITDVPEIAQIIAAAGAGAVVPYQAQALSDSLEKYLSDAAFLEQSKIKARQLAERYSWEAIFDRAFACAR